MNKKCCILFVTFVVYYFQYAPGRASPGSLKTLSATKRVTHKVKIQQAFLASDGDSGPEEPRRLPAFVAAIFGPYH